MKNISNRLNRLELSNSCRQSFLVWSELGMPEKDYRKKYNVPADAELIIIRWRNDE